MMGRKLSHYEVLGEISRGGMGVVYRARDVKLEREVALKVLPPEPLADPDRRDRFVREAQAAARLQHPHIAVVHEIDTHEGVTFIVMELIDGVKLSDRLAEGVLGVDEVLRLAIEVAEGLGFAHEHGIVHRDLKPGNVLVTVADHAKIIDFGLAKLFPAPGGEASETATAVKSETDSGIVMGTVSYMSPEQARGQRVDKRSDVFSFGIVLYEMLTGTVPFTAASSVEILNAILKEAPAPLEPARLGAPKESVSELQRIVDKCLAKDPAERYQTMRDLLVDLRAVRRGAEPPVSTGGKRWPVTAAVATALVILLLATLYFLRPPVDRVEPLSVADSGRPSVAVLYFENVTGDPSLDWLRTGLTDMLVTDLSQAPGVEVLSTDRLHGILSELNRLDERVTSVEVVRDVAERAGAETVVLGSFMQAGEEIRINLRIQDADTGRILSSHKVEGTGESEIFPMVDELTRRIRGNFEAAPAEGGLDRDLKDVTTSSIEAYRAYAEGIRLFERGLSTEAIPHFERAIELDPGFAMAMAKLSAIHSNASRIAEANAYRVRAFENIDRLTARERYYVEGHYYWRRYPTWDRAANAFRRAVTLYPDHASARNNLAVTLMAFGRYEEAARHYQELVRRGEPFPGAHGGLADAHLALGDFERGRRVLEAYVERNPDNARAHALLGQFLSLGGEGDEALRVLDRAEALGAEPPAPHVGRYYVHFFREDWEQAEASARRLIGADPPVARWLGFQLAASLHLVHGRSRRALEILEEVSRIEPQPENLTAWVHFRTALIELALRRPDRADAAARRADELGRDTPIAPWTAYILARIEAELGEDEAAEAWAARLGELSEQVPSSRAEERLRHQLAGELALYRDDPDDAVEALERAASLLPGRSWPGIGSSGIAPHVPLWFSLATAHLHAGNDEEAARWFQTIVDSTSERLQFPIEWIRSFYFLGRIHERRGEVDKAHRFYRRFVEHWKDGDLDGERVQEALQKLP